MGSDTEFKKAKDDFYDDLAQFIILKTKFLRIALQDTDDDIQTILEMNTTDFKFESETDVRIAKNKIASATKILNARLDKITNSKAEVIKKKTRKEKIKEWNTIMNYVLLCIVALIIIGCITSVVICKIRYNTFDVLQVISNTYATNEANDNDTSEESGLVIKNIEIENFDKDFDLYLNEYSANKEIVNVELKGLSSLIQETYLETMDSLMENEGYVLYEYKDNVNDTVEKQVSTYLKLDENDEDLIKVGVENGNIQNISIIFNELEYQQFEEMTSVYEDLIKQELNSNTIDYESNLYKIKDSDCEIIVNSIKKINNYEVDIKIKRDTEEESRSLIDNRVNELKYRYNINVIESIVHSYLDSNKEIRYREYSSYSIYQNKTMYRLIAEIGYNSDEEWKKIGYIELKDNKYEVVFETRNTRLFSKLYELTSKLGMTDIQLNGADNDARASGIMSVDGVVYNVEIQAGTTTNATKLDISVEK